MNTGPQSLAQAFDQDGRLVFTRVFILSGPFARLRGLLGRAPPEIGEAWWFCGCSSIHTFGMTFAIDVLHLSREGEILRIRPGVKPLRFSICRDAAQVLELREGAATALALEVGRRLWLRR